MGVNDRKKEIFSDPVCKFLLCSLTGGMPSPISSVAVDAQSNIANRLLNSWPGQSRVS